jgi:hypothetical protein
MRTVPRGYQGALGKGALSKEALDAEPVTCEALRDV